MHGFDGPIASLFADQLASDLAQRREEAAAEVTRVRAVLDREGKSVRDYLALASGYRALDQIDSAIETCREGTTHYPASARLHRQLISWLNGFGRTDEAVVAAHEAARRLPDDSFLRFSPKLILPIVPSSLSDVVRGRRLFLEGIDDVIRLTPLDSPDDVRNAAKGIGEHFRYCTLPYEGRSDLELNKRYGAFAHRVMTARYPQWSQPMPSPPPDAQGRLRIGYVSAFFGNHHVVERALGWMAARDRDAVAVHCYHVGDETDFKTEPFKRAASVFSHVPSDLEAVCQRIRQDRLHVLVYVDLGLDPQTTRMAALRLAPIQCATWLNPQTSGLPTIDYFLSSAAMEPQDGHNHYSETLVRLPNLGIHERRPVLPRALFSRSRASFGLRDDAVVYLACQWLSKFLPQQDRLFAEIAARNTSAQFAIMTGDASPLAQFRDRLAKTFDRIGLDVERHCVFLPRQFWVTYLNLHAVSDVFLDTIGWSGGLTTLDAIASGLPVVTMPGAVMRGCQSTGMLRLMGITETIAADEEDYVRIAVGLRDATLRRRIAKHIAERRSILYEDGSAVHALESFFRTAVAQGQQ